MLKVRKAIRCWRLAILLSGILLGGTSAIAQDAAPAERRKQPADALDGPPLVTAKGWIIGDGRTGRTLWEFQAETARPIASTTKIMTAWLVVQLIEQDKSVADQIVTFSERADNTSGSTAAILAGERLTARDLLFGLLLPSGNDAAVALAEHFGGNFQPAGDSAERSPEGSLAAFVVEMNRTAKTL